MPTSVPALCVGGEGTGRGWEGGTPNTLGNDYYEFQSSWSYINSLQTKPHPITFHNPMLTRYAILHYDDVIPTTNSAPSPTYKVIECGAPSLN